jgi:maltose phosphorylase
LDDYNHEADEGLHITSMAGTWLSMVEGFAGIRIQDDTLIVNPLIPKAWSKYSFQILLKNNPIVISVTHNQVEIENRGALPIKMILNGKLNEVQPSKLVGLQLN